VQQQWSTIKQCIYTAAKEITGTIQPSDRNQWFDHECNDAIGMSNIVQINMLQRKTRASTKEYKNAKRNKTNM
jgi:hypothetical protein